MEFKICFFTIHWQYHLIGLVVKTCALRADPGFDSCLHCGNFPGMSHTSDLKIGTLLATLPGAWRYRVSAGTGWHGVSILWLGEVDSLICNYYLSAAARKLVWADPFPEVHWHVAGMLSRQQTNDSAVNCVPSASCPGSLDTWGGESSHLLLVTDVKSHCLIGLKHLWTQLK